MSAADVEAWRVYVAGELARFYAHCEGDAYVWQSTPAAERLRARLGRGDAGEAAFTGPWHVIRPHVTGEFRQWVEEYEATERLTLSQWRAAQVAERREVAWTESADYALGQLIELRRLIAERDAIIVEAAKRGATKVAIASAVGLSRQQVHTIIAASELAPVTPIRPEVAPVHPLADQGISYVRNATTGELEEVF